MGLSEYVENKIKKITSVIEKKTYTYGRKIFLGYFDVINPKIGTAINIVMNVALNNQRRFSKPACMPISSLTGLKI